jgi:TolA-binding protein
MHSASLVRGAPIGITLVCTLATATCMTRGQGERIRSDVVSMRLRLDDIEKRDKEHAEQVAELRKVLDRATALLTANSADIGGKEAKAETDIAALQGKVDELGNALEQGGKRRAQDQNRFETRVAVLEQSEARIIDRVAPMLPEDKDQLWQQAEARLKSGQRDEGRHFYRVFIQRFPQDPRASRAYLEIGRSLAEEKQFPKAAAEFQRLLDTYPRSPEVPEAMWQLSAAFVQLRFCTDARSLLGDLVKRYPKSAPAVEAEKEMKAIKRLPKTACTS